MESRRDRVVGGSCGFCLFEAAPGPIRPLPMTNPDGVPDFGLYRVVRLFFVRGGAESVESLWTILICAVFGFRVRGLDCPHSSHTSACRRCICELALWVRGGAESMESGGQSFPALSIVRRSGLGLPTFPQPHPAAASKVRHPVFAAHDSRDLHKALAITTSLRATAVTTTLCGFPSFRSRSAKTFKSLL